jgi:hypothetical protein
MYFQVVTNFIILEAMTEQQMIQNNGKDIYYIYDGEKYAPTFPLKLAKKFKKGTGPKNCLNCSSFARWNGVMIGLCANCACYEYKFKYGPGFISYGIEYPEWTNGISAFESYLKDVNLDEIGDKNICDSKKEIEGYNFDPYWSEDYPDEYGITGSGKLLTRFDISEGYDSY